MCVYSGDAKFRQRRTGLSFEPDQGRHVTESQTKNANKADATAYVAAKMNKVTGFVPAPVLFAAAA